MLGFAAAAVIASAGWFGPSNYDDCVAQYAVSAAAKRLVGFATTSCKDAFDETKPALVRARGLCQAERIPDAKSEWAIQLIQTECERQHPTPRCAAQQEYSLAKGACQWTCPAGQIYIEADHKCVRFNDPFRLGPKRLVPYEGPVVNGQR